VGIFLLLVAKNSFFDEKCNRLSGRCTDYCLKNEELTSLCRKTLKCCVTVQPCERSKGNDSAT
ncbi:Beta-defensin 15, partial [Lemmus lemmus]